MGCGKSAAAEYISKNLADSLVLDVDLLAKEIYRKDSSVVEKISALFGKEILKNDGSINFARLGRIVFDDIYQMKKLNELMFPIINKNVEKFIKSNQDRKYIILDAAVLFNAGLDRFCDKIIYLTAGTKEQEKFLKCKNSDMSIKDIRQRVCNQKIDIDMNKIDFIIENDSALEDLREKISLLIKKLRLKNN